MGIRTLAVFCTFLLRNGPFANAGTQNGDVLSPTLQ